jgi:hypothetical protein
MSVVGDDIEPLTFTFEDDGIVPNNPMPLLLYKQAIDVDNDHPEKTIEGLFGANGWGDMWRNGIYDYLHYHATVHAALPAAMRGSASVVTAARSSRFQPATSPFSPRAPGISAFPRARIFPWSAPIRRDPGCTSRCRRPRIIARRWRRFRKRSCPRPIRCWERTDRW